MTETNDEFLRQLRAARRQPADAGVEAAPPIGALIEDLREMALVPAGPGHPIPCLSPLRKTAPLDETVLAERSAVKRLLLRHGAVLLRGFSNPCANQVTGLATSLCGQLVDYVERSTPRRLIGDGVYSATEYPRHQRINLHNENTYAHDWPDTLFFWCVRPADSGGASLLADSREILSSLSGSTVEAFRRKRVLYMRELGPPLGMAWRYVFQCDRKEDVDEACRSKGYSIEWLDGERARLSRVADALRRHPETGEACWFNHGLFFHESSLDPVIREGLRALYGDGYLPHRSMFGDGSAIDDDILSDLRRAHQQCEVKLLLQEHDVLCVDNVLMAHGRDAYEGQRDIRLVMARRVA